MELAEVLEQAWSLLQRGVADPRSPVRTPVLATVGPDHRPNARTVALQRVDPSGRRLFVHTDQRSPKHAELLLIPRGVFVVYDPEVAVQLRLDALITVHEGDRLAREAWDALDPSHKALYLGAAAPGVRAEHPIHGYGESHDATLLEQGFRHFSVLEGQVIYIDWLHFAKEGTLRAAFLWHDKGERPEGMWLYP